LQINSARYIQSSPDIKGCPVTDLPEFAFIGRSNVGKSSLINMITGRANLALTSSKPGKTRNINHFLINEKWYLVDLPGYGYAQISQMQRDMWLRNIQTFFIRRENLRNVFLLIDASIAPQQKDIEFTNWLGTHSIPFCIVFTKTDKEKALKMKLNIKSFKAELAKTWDELPPFILSSTEKQLGKQEILDYIDKSLAIPKK
jgi:GTP-binding protein